MTPEQIREARALCEAATPGEWTDDGLDVFDAHGEFERSIVSADNLIATVPTSCFDATEAGVAPRPRADAAFIAAARTLLPAALDALDGARTGALILRGEIDALRTMVEQRDAEIARLRIELRELNAAVVAHKGNSDRLLPALMKNLRLREALHDAIRCPMGVVPDSAAEFYEPTWPDPGSQVVS